MEHHRDLARGEPEDRRRLLIENLVHDLDLREVVAGSERSELGRPALPGPARQRGGVAAGQAALGLGQREVLRLSVTGADGPRGPRPEHVVEVAVRELRDRALAADARGDVALNLRHQGAQAAAHVAGSQVRAHEPHTAVDVVPDAPRRDDAVGGVEGGHAADRETVPLVHVRHRERRSDDARKVGDVARLVQRPVAADRCEEPLAGKDAGGHPHPALGRDLPDAGPDPLDVLAHFSTINVRPGGGAAARVPPVMRGGGDRSPARACRRRTSGARLRRPTIRPQRTTVPGLRGAT